MSSAETPPDPDEPEPSEEQISAAGRNMMIATVLLILAAVFLLPR
jgi:hypothetical protein